MLHSDTFEETIAVSQTTISSMMPAQPTLAELALHSTDTLLHELKHHRCFRDPIQDPSDPYLKMISTYRKFHTSVVKAIERGDVDTMSLVRDGLIDAMYKGIPRLGVNEFRAWAKLADMTHPLRRLANQHLFVTIVRVQARCEFDSLASKVLAIIDDCEEMRERVYDLENLVKDPDELHFFRNENGIQDVAVVKDAEGTCLICTEEFDDTLYLPQRGPCGHIICKQCFNQWLLECSKTYTCPMCRACVVCGANPCADHLMETKEVRPVPLPKLLDSILPHATGEGLHEIKPESYWELREFARESRMLLAYIDSQLPLGVDATDPVVLALVRERSIDLDGIKATVHRVAGV